MVLDMKNLTLLALGAGFQVIVTAIMFLIFGATEKTLGLSGLLILFEGIIIWYIFEKYGSLNGKDYLFVASGSALILTFLTFFV